MSQKLKIDSDTFNSHYPDKPFVVGHNLCDHPLFQVERMLELLKILPDHKVSYFTGKVGVNEDKRKAPPTGLTAEETIRQIQNAESIAGLTALDAIRKRDTREARAEMEAANLLIQRLRDFRDDGRVNNIIFITPVEKVDMRIQLDNLIEKPGNLPGSG